MIGWLCLGIGVVCALVSRVLLTTAAFSISLWWGIGVLLPFGPVLFRLSYPDEVKRARIFGVISVLCLFGFITFGPGLHAMSLHRRTVVKDARSPAKPVAYAIEKPNASAAPSSTPASFEDRRAANNQEFVRLEAWNEKLRLTKRDLLRSDVEAVRRFNDEATEFNNALVAANVEKAAIDSQK
jgi:hypothetical protein